MDRVLVTGAQGLLGRQVVRTLLDGGATVLGVGRSDRDDAVYTHDLAWRGGRVAAPVPAELRPDGAYAYEVLDVRDAAAVADLAGAFAPDAVVHTAAALRDASLAALVASNVEATAGLLEGLARAGRPRVVLTSSGSVYGAGGGRVPFAEDGPAEPLDLYGVTKRAGEDLARVLAAQSGLDLVQARVFNLVGPGLQDRHLPARLAGLLAEIACGLAEPVLRLGPLGATRDFVDVRDAADALVLLARRRGGPAVVNVASGVETPVREVLRLLLEASGTLGEVVVHEQEPPRVQDVPRAVADVRRLAALGVRAGRPIAATLSGMLAYFAAFPGASADRLPAPPGAAPARD